MKQFPHLSLPDLLWTKIWNGESYICMCLHASIEYWLLGFFSLHHDFHFKHFPDINLCQWKCFNWAYKLCKHHWNIFEESCWPCVWTSNLDIFKLKRKRWQKNNSIFFMEWQRFSHSQIFQLIQLWTWSFYQMCFWFKYF